MQAPEHRGHAATTRHDDQRHRAPTHNRRRKAHDACREPGLERLRKQHLVGWTDERARQPCQPDSRINQGLRVKPRSRERAQRDSHHQRGDQNVYRAAHDRNLFLGHHVDRMPGEQRRTKVRHDLGQTNEAERQRIAGDVVDVPAHRHRKNLVA